MADSKIKVSNCGTQIVPPINTQPKGKGATAIRGTDLRGGKK
ncbi:MAG: hypothetical protein RR394_08735 [Oscillospiraceae bacterium]